MAVAKAKKSKSRRSTRANPASAINAVSNAEASGDEANKGSPTEDEEEETTATVTPAAKISKKAKKLALKNPDLKVGVAAKGEKLDEPDKDSGSIGSKSALISRRKRKKKGKRGGKELSSDSLESKSSKSGSKKSRRRRKKKRRGSSKKSRSKSTEDDQSRSSKRKRRRRKRSESSDTEKAKTIPPGMKIIRLTPEQKNKLAQIAAQRRAKNIQQTSGNFRWFTLFFLRIFMCIVELSMIVVLFLLPGFGQKLLHVLPVYGDKHGSIFIVIFIVSGVTNLYGAVIAYHSKSLAIWAEKCIIVKCYLAWISYQMMLHFVGFVTCSMAIQNLHNVVIPKDLRMILHTYHTNEEVHYFVDHLQSDNRCCGIHGPKDWRKSGDNNATISLPQSCCSTNKCRYGILDQAENKSLHGNGCYVPIMEGIEKEMSTKAYLFGIVVLLQIPLFFWTVFSIPNFKMLRKFFFLSKLFEKDDPMDDFQPMPTKDDIVLVKASSSSRSSSVGKNNANNYTSFESAVQGDSSHSNSQFLDEGRRYSVVRAGSNVNEENYKLINRKPKKRTSKFTNVSKNCNEDEEDSESEIKPSRKDYKRYQNYMKEENSRKRIMLELWVSDNRFYPDCNSNFNQDNNNNHANICNNNQNDNEKTAQNNSDDSQSTTNSITSHEPLLKTDRDKIDTFVYSDLISNRIIKNRKN